MLDFETDNVIHVPVNVQTTSPEAIRTLEEARQRRRAELANWEPSTGWLMNRPNTRLHARVIGAR